MTDTFCFNIAKDDVTVLRQACQMFRRDFMEVGKVDVFLDPCTIASACNKVSRKRFLKPETIGLIPSGGYSCNGNYSKNALLWILHMEEEDNLRYYTLETGAKLDYQNCHGSVSMGTAPKHAPTMNLWDVSFTVVSNVNRLVTSKR